MEKSPIELYNNNKLLIKQLILQKKFKDKLSSTSTVTKDQSSIQSSASLSTPSSSLSTTSDRVPLWYFGGLASAGAACITHPLDTMKVYYQTNGLVNGRQTLFAVSVQLIRQNGLLTLYSGLTASILRQLTYSTVRFGIYEMSKQKLLQQHQQSSSSATTSTNQILPFYERMIIATISGTLGGLVGTPADVVNVRMQNDIKLEKKFKRNYRHVLQGLTDIYSNEGFRSLFRGSSMVICRSILVTIGQLAMYDQFKYWLIEYSGKFRKNFNTNMLNMTNDNIETHVISSVCASICCTILTQPFDVLKTRIMNSSSNDPNGGNNLMKKKCSKNAIINEFKNLYNEYGLRGYFKGFLPSLVRIGPHTILVFIIYEQLRLNYGHQLSAG